MAFETGVFVSTTDLLSKIELFLTGSCGFSLLAGAGSVLNKGDIYAQFADGLNPTIQTGTSSTNGGLDLDPLTSCPVKYLRNTTQIYQGTMLLSDNLPATYYFMYADTPDHFSCVVVSSTIYSQ